MEVANRRHRDDPFEELRIENRKLRERGDKLFNDYVDATLALGLVTGIYPPFNETTMKRAQALLDRRKVEWEARGIAMTAQATAKDARLS